MATFHVFPLAFSPASPSSQSKGMLQVYLQQRGYPLPLYEPQPTTGPSHKPLFTIRVRVRGGGGGVLWEGTGEGRTKKEAESTAARKCLEYFQLQEKEIPVSNILFPGLVHHYPIYL